MERVLVILTPGAATSTNAPYSDDGAVTSLESVEATANA